MYNYNDYIIHVSYYLYIYIFMGSRKSEKVFFLKNFFIKNIFIYKYTRSSMGCTHMYA